VLGGERTTRGGRLEKWETVPDWTNKDKKRSRKKTSASGSKCQEEGQAEKIVGIGLRSKVSQGGKKGRKQDKQVAKETQNREYGGKTWGADLSSAHQVVELKNGKSLSRTQRTGIRNSRGGNRTPTVQSNTKSPAGRPCCRSREQQFR